MMMMQGCCINTHDADSDALLVAASFIALCGRKPTEALLKNCRSSSNHWQLGWSTGAQYQRLIFSDQDVFLVHHDAAWSGFDAGFEG